MRVAKQLCMFVLLAFSVAISADVDVRALGIESEQGYSASHPRIPGLSYWFSFVVDDEGGSNLCMGIAPRPETITCVNLNELDGYEIKLPAEIEIDPEQQSTTG